MNLTDALFGDDRITVRRLLNLLWGLPADSALREAVTPAPKEPEIRADGKQSVKAGDLRSVLGGR